MSPKHSNHLIHESSPYLLQHAHNPVNWYPWSDEALKKAREENKPILVSIGYSACHWCHVMERESFEDEATAAIMNDHFINIKIDREERPDLDHIYMDAVQAMSGAGGWPLNVFLTPDGKPFYGGTYFPPSPAFNRPSWKDILEGVRLAFSERRNEIDAQAENLIDHLRRSNSFELLPTTGPGQEFTTQMTDETVNNLLKQADMTWGGFGKAPKFPQSFAIQFLLRHHSLSGKSSNIPENDVAFLSLDRMIGGGIYDQLGGGFARYSTDNEWLAPHFEKMLYDNALLVSVISEAYQLTGRERYKEVIGETIDFVQRELLHPQNGFYAALDADSEGVEGKFYVWDKKEIDELLGSDAAIFSEYYDISEHGNWEEKNILRVKEPLSIFAARKKLDAGSLKQLLQKAGKKLMAYRSKRIHPQLDDKIILGWNALMNTAVSKAFAATDLERYRQLAIDNMEFLLSKFRVNNSHEFYHTWKNDIAKYPAFLDDYAFLIQALIHLQEITAEKKWLHEARAITEFVIAHFGEINDPGTVKDDRGDDRNPFFYYTHSAQQDIIIRKKELYDGAVPSGNSVMASNLYHLSILFDRPEWKQRSLHATASLSKAIVKYPTSFGNWACLLLEIVSGTNEIAITGKQFGELHRELLRAYIPHRVLMVSEEPDPEFPLLADKPGTQPSSIWLCRNFSCQAPVTTVKALRTLIDRAG